MVGILGSYYRLHLIPEDGDPISPIRECEGNIKYRYGTECAQGKFNAGITVIGQLQRFSHKSKN
jgi:hypothetical protein